MTSIEVSFWWVLGLNVFLAAVILWPARWRKFILVALLAVASAAWWERYQEYLGEHKVEAAIQIAIDACVEGNVQSAYFRSVRETAGVMLEIDRLNPSRHQHLSAVLDSEMNRKGCGHVARARKIIWETYGLQEKINYLLGKSAPGKARRTSSGRLTQQLQARPLDEVNVRIYSRPSGAMVIINDQEIGPSPVNIDLEPGDYTVSFRQRGYRPIDKDVTINIGHPELIEVSLERE